MPDAQTEVSIRVGVIVLLLDRGERAELGSAFVRRELGRLWGEISAHENFESPYVWRAKEHPYRRLNKSRPPTRPTSAAISPSRLESAKTDALP